VPDRHLRAVPAPLDFYCYAGAAERLEAWRTKGPDAYADVLRRHYMPDGSARCQSCAHRWHGSGPCDHGRAAGVDSCPCPGG